METFPLSISDLAVSTARRGEPPLFRNASLKLAAGEFVSIMGENGVGKTTLLETILNYRT